MQAAVGINSAIVAAVIPQSTFGGVVAHVFHALPSVADVPFVTALGLLLADTDLLFRAWQRAGAAKRSRGLNATTGKCAGITNAGHEPVSLATMAV